MLKRHPNQQKLHLELATRTKQYFVWKLEDENKNIKNAQKICDEILPRLASLINNNYNTNNNNNNNNNNDAYAYEGYQVISRDSNGVPDILMEDD